MGASAPGTQGGEHGIKPGARGGLLLWVGVTCRVKSLTPDQEPLWAPCPIPVTTFGGHVSAPRPAVLQRDPACSLPPGRRLAPALSANRGAPDGALAFTPRSSPSCPRSFRVPGSRVTRAWAGAHTCAVYREQCASWPQRARGLDPVCCR